MAYSHTDDRVLAELAKSSNKAIRASVAGNHNASQKTLAELSRDPDWSVRAQVARNPFLSSLEAFWTLAYDSDAEVRFYVAGHVGLSMELLRALVLDESPDISSEAQYYLTWNHIMPPDYTAQQQDSEEHQ